MQLARKTRGEHLGSPQPPVTISTTCPHAPLLHLNPSFTLRLLESRLPSLETPQQTQVAPQRRPGLLTSDPGGRLLTLHQLAPKLAPLQSPSFSATISSAQKKWTKVTG